MTATAAALPADPNLHGFWEAVGEYARLFVSLFGAPTALAQRLWLPRAEHKRALAFLRPLESLLRRLLLLAALALPAPKLAPPERKRTRARAMPINAGAAFTPETPELWRTRFAVLRDTRAHAAAAKPKAPLAGAIAAAPLALRFEALLRAYTDRDAEARRVALLLVRRKLAHDEALRILIPSAFAEPAQPPALTPVAPTLEALDLYIRNRPRADSS